MKIIISKNQLNESIQHVSKALSSRTTNPILNGIKMDADITGVTLTASDAENSIQSFIPIEVNDMTIVEIIEKGSIVLPAKFFIDMTKKLPSQKIEIEVNEQYLTLIKSGSAEVQLAGLDPQEYPSLPSIEENKMIVLASDILKTMIRQTVFAVSTNESATILTGVLWNLSNEEIKCTACDRHRLATREVNIESGTNIQSDFVVISGRTLHELAKILPDDNKLIQIVVSENQILFKIENILFYSRILSGTYPDTSKLIPGQYQTEIEINKNDLANAIDRAYLLSREEKTNIVKLTMLDNNNIEISSSSSEIGKVTEQVNVQSITGELLKISFNSKYMLDSLKAIDSEVIHIGFTGAMQPIIITPKDETKVLQLILPYRTMN